MGKKVLITLVALASINCITFRQQAIPVAEGITTKLEEVSKLADKAVATGIMSKSDRQEFSKQVMLPAIEGTQLLAGCILGGNCKNLTLGLGTISRSLLVGVNSFISKMPASDIKTQLLDKLNSLIIFVNNLYIRAGGKVEKQVNQLDSFVYSQAFSF